MQKITYETIVPFLLEKFPEYKNSDSYDPDMDDDNPYVMLASLCAIVSDNIDEKKDTILAERLLKISNDVFNDPDSAKKGVFAEDTLENFFRVTVLEDLVLNLKDFKLGVQLVKKYLHGKSLENLEACFPFLKVDEFVEEYRKKE